MSIYSRLVASVVALLLAVGVLLSSSASANPFRTLRLGKQTAPSSLTTIEVQNDVKLANAKRFGINIGQHSPFGAAQYFKNIVPNPGFEASEFGMVFLAQPGAGGSRVQADNWQTQWNNEQQALGHPAGFWNNAEFEVVYGPAKWRSGTVDSFSLENNSNTFYLNPAGEPPQVNDVVFVRKQVGGYDFDTDPYNRADSAETRPGSAGSQALRLTPPAQEWQASWSQAFDTYFRDQDNGGSKFLVVDGTWQFELWARATQPNDSVRIVFQRLGENIFFDETIPLSQEWTKIERQFTVAPGTDELLPWAQDMPRNGLSLEVRIKPDGGDVLIDDIGLARTGQSNPTEFTDKFVQYLQQLQPGILRNWGAQLGSSLDNQLATPHGRKTTGFSPKYRVAPNYHYSLHDFLELSELVGAEPWYVIPPTFSRSDMTNLAAYLSAPAGSHPYADIRASLGQETPWTDVFSTIHLEYGNEIWGNNSGNDPFLGASMRGGERAGNVAHDRLGIYKGSPFFNEQKINFVIGGQAFFPGRQAQLESASDNHNTIGIAPYFAKTMDFVEGGDEALFQALYAHPQQSVTDSVVTQGIANINGGGAGTKTAIYEINIHTLAGNMSLTHRNVFLAGQGASLALPLTMMTYQSELGVRDLIPYQALQFSTLTPENYYGRIFGLLRDLEATGRKRPTWLATELGNRAVRKDMISTVQSGDNPTFTAQPGNGIATAQTVNTVQSFAYRDGDSYALALFNLDITDAHETEIRLPASPAFALPNATIHRLEGETVYANNEDWPKVAITTTPIDDFASGYKVNLEPHSMVVIEWTATEQKPVAPPVGVDDSYSLIGPGSISGNVLDNDSDPNGDAISAEKVTDPSNGTLLLNSDGTFSYIPNGGFTGTDTFTYRVSDGELFSAETTVRLVILPADADRVYLPFVTR